jgi:hypothetical protein
MKETGIRASLSKELVNHANSGKQSGDTTIVESALEMKAMISLVIWQYEEGPNRGTAKNNGLSMAENLNLEILQ